MKMHCGVFRSRPKSRVATKNSRGTVMSGKVTRRRFVRGVSSAFAASAILDRREPTVTASHEKTVRLAFVGVGNRGTSLLRLC
jgi:hypothetical protein